MLLHPDDEASNIRVAALPQSDPLLDFSPDIDRTAIGTDPRHESPSRASRAWRAFVSEVARGRRQCLTWLSNCQADLKVGLYERAVGFHERAVALYAMAVGLYRTAGRAGEAFARATLGAFV